LQNVNILYVNNEADAFQQIKNSVRCILVTSDDFGTTFIPSLYSGLKSLSNLNSAIVMTNDKGKTLEWSRDFSIVKAVTSDHASLLSSAVKLSNEVHVCNVDKKE
jgi:hypothetical protein